MRLLKRISLVLCILVCICQLSYAAPRDDARRLNGLYAMPIEALVRNWFLEFDNLVQSNKRDEIDDGEYRKRLAYISIRTDNELEIIMERLYKESVPKELESLEMSIMSTGAVGRVIAQDTLNLANNMLTVKEYFEKLDYNFTIYERSLNWIDREYMKIAEEDRHR